MDSTDRAQAAAAVISVAKKKKIAHDPNKPHQLSTGYWAFVKPVSLAIIQEAQASVPMPVVPIWYDENKDREIENPNDPAYQLALSERPILQGIASMDAVTLWGVDLCNEDGSHFEIDLGGSWLKKLRFMEKRGQLSLASYDLADPLDLEFLFKRYIALSVSDVNFVMEVSGVSADVNAEVDRQMELFPNNSA